MQIKSRFITGLYLLALLGIGLSCGQKEEASNFFLKGNVQLGYKNYESAIHYYNEAIEKNPDLSDAYLNKGIALLRLGLADEAYKTLTEAINIDNGFPELYLTRAEAALRSGKTETAENDLNYIAKDYQDSARYHMVMGNLMSTRNNAAQALASFDRAVALNPSHVEALVNRGALYYQQKEYEQAEKDFTKAVSLNPKQPEALNNMGLLASRRQNWEQALSYFDRSLQINPVDPYALNNKGYALLQTNQLKDAQALIERSLQSLPENGYALRNLGLYYQKTGNLPKATEQFEAALDLAQPVDNLYGFAGKAYFDQGQKEKACGLWRRGTLLKDSLAVEYHEKYCL
jgi:tetratricopeptide (TPR) repeat protein